MRSVAADGADISTFSSSLGAGEEFRREQRRQARCAEENCIRTAHVFFQYTIIFAIIRTYDTESELGIYSSQVGPIWASVDFLQEVLRTGEASVHDIDVMNVFASKG